MENVVLIGMPGAGKSTVGVVLAKAMGYEFLDSDLLIQKQYDKLLCQLMDEYGREGFIKIEDEVNRSIEARNTVIATGGSVVYGEGAMEHLRDIGTVIYLKLPYEEIESRLGSLHDRGVVLAPGQTLRDLYEERCVLYEKFAHIIVETDNLSIRDTVSEIKEKLEQV